METNEIKKIIEVLIFISDKPLSTEILKAVLEEETVLIEEAIAQLRAEYDAADKGFRFVEIAGGYQFMTDPKYAPWLKKLYKTRVGKLSMPALETLAILAYKQPLTRAEIEAIRGVNIDGVVKNLVDKGLIRICGRKDVPGRPFVYGTTKDFLEYFGLTSLEDLPMQHEFRREQLGLPEGGASIEELPETEEGENTDEDSEIAG